MPTLKQAHLQFAQANRTKPKLQKSLLCQRTTTQQMDRQTTYRKEERRHNSGFAKKRVQWLIEHSTSYQHLWFIESLVLRNPLLRKAANRYASPYQKCLQTLSGRQNRKVNKVITNKFSILAS